MSACTYLVGENIAPRSMKEARALIGKRVRYLRTIDIDKSGRGYFFPKVGTVEQVNRAEIDMGDGNWEYLRSIVEMTEVSA